ncbi:hypothetical protein [Parvularcula dongshanensis]|uniref:Uncharacterized protein (PEP-CTERM system associated) n=1 Tax=Parvularcula dongshanensis TaxID=1173995 RepID=A0A840I731_9PROT|nr:hypothetical protein [Parvularcula dongshanensis]MBB4659790.1 uncharacterized protein (PEP-CTERM system associated) [Parvularcula dongshanensis]
MTTRRHRPARRALLCAASGLAVAALPAAAQDTYRPDREGQDVPNRRVPAAPRRNLVSSWNLDLRATYSDNFRRLSDQRARYFLRADETGDESTVGVLVPRIDDEGAPVVDEETGEPIIDFVPTLQLVDVEPPDNVVLSASLRGATVYERAGLTGVVNGGVRVGTYADRASLDQRLLDSIDPNVALPDGVLATDRPTFGLNDLDEVFIEPNIAGSATARIVDDLFYVDASAVAEQQALSTRNNLSAESSGALDNRIVFAGGSLSPYIFRNVAEGGSVEARYRYTGVFVVDENLDQSERFTGERLFLVDEGQNYANDSTAHEGILEYRSGDLLDKIAFRVTGVANRTEESGSDILAESKIERLSAEVEGAYEINSVFAATASVGYDDVSVELTPQGFVDSVPPTDNTESGLSGVWWTVGFTAVPSRRSSLQVRLGERFSGTLLEVEGHYRPSARINVTASAERRLDTGTQGTFRGFRGFNSRTVRVLDQLSNVQAGSAERLLEQAVSFQGGFDDVTRQGSGAGAYDRYSLSATYFLRRTSVSASVNYTGSDLFGLGGGTDDNSNSIVSLNGQVRRQISRRLSAYANARYQRNDGRFYEDVIVGLEGNRDRNSSQIFGAVGAAWQLGPQLSATGQIYHAERSSTGTQLDYKENAVSAGLRWTF